MTPIIKSENNSYKKLMDGEQNSNPNFHRLILICIAVSYFFIKLQLVLVDAFIPDEVWHTSYMESSDFSFTEQPMYQGFGSLYWHFGSWISHTTGVSMLFFMRIFCLLSMTLGGFFLTTLFKSKKPYEQILIGVFVFTTPLFWNGGKMNSPEMFAMAFAMGGLVLVSMSDLKLKNFGWLLLGVAIGFKINFAPIFAFAFLAFSNFSRSQRRSLLTSVGLSIFGFFLVNSSLIFHFSNSIRDFLVVANNGSRSFSDLGILPYAFFSLSSILSWDLIYYGTFFSSQIHFASFILCLGFLGFLSWKQKKLRLFLSLLMALLLFAAMTFLHNQFVPYYAFSITLMVLFAALFFFRESTGKQRIGVHAVLLSSILMNLPLSYQIYVRDSHLLNWQADYIEKRQEMQICFTNFLKDVPIEKSLFFVNNSSFASNHMRETTLSPAEAAVAVPWLEELNKNQKLIVTQGSHAQTLLRYLEEKTKSDKKTLIVYAITKKVSEMENYRSLWDDYEKLLASNQNFKIVQSSPRRTCGELTMGYYDITWLRQ